MKKTKILMAFAASLLLVGCGAKPAPSSSQKAPSSSQKASSSKVSSSKESTSKAPTTWTEISKDGVVHKETKGDAVAYRVDIAEATGWNKSTTKMNGKAAPDNEANWDITGKIPSGNYQVELEALMTYESHSDRYFYNQYQTDSGQNADKESEDPFRYFLKVDGATINPDTKKSWGEIGFQGENQSGAPVFGEFISSMAVAADAKSLSLMHGNIGYSLIVSRVRLIAIPAAK